MKWHYAAPFSVDDKLLHRISVAGKKLLLIKYAGEYFVLGTYCPHAGADLLGGWCEHGRLICPFHRYAYDLSTGRGDPGQNDYVDTFPVEIRADGVYVGIKSIWDIFR